MQGNAYTDNKNQGNPNANSWIDINIGKLQAIMNVMIPNVKNNGRNLQITEM